MYAIGDESPDFKIKLINGVEFHLFNTLKNSSVLVNFIRGTWCEECTSHLKRIETWRSQLNERTKPVTAIIITVEEQQKLRDWLKENPTMYLMAADTTGDVAKTFGFMVPEDAYSKPGMMLIGRDKKIQLISDDLLSAQSQTREILEINL